MTWHRISADLEERAGRTVADVSELESVASTVYDVTFSDAERVVVKVPRIEQGNLAEPRLIEFVANEPGVSVPAVPVPDVLDVREEMDPSYFVMEYRDGAGISRFGELTGSERREFAFEVGRLLGAVHVIDPPVGTFGRVRCDGDGDLYTIEGFGTWRPRFEDLMRVNLDALAELRLGDLVPRLRTRLDGAYGAVPDVATPALNYFDCKVGNFVLSRASGITIDSVLDWEALSTTHWAFNLAFPERYLRRRASTPAERRRLVEDLYAGYAESRGWDELVLDDDWYTAYLLAAFVLLAASPYWLADREDWSGAEADRLRSQIRALLDRPVAVTD